MDVSEFGWSVLEEVEVDFEGVAFDFLVGRVGRHLSSEMEACDLGFMI